MAEKKRAKLNSNADDESPFLVRESYRGISGRICVYSFTPRRPMADLVVLHSQLKSPASFVCMQRLIEYEGLKIQVRCKVSFYKATSPDTTIESFFSSKAHELLRTTDVEKKLTELLSEIEGTVEKYLHRGSGWVIDCVEFVDLYTICYRPLTGSCYHLISMPAGLKKHPAIINIQSDDLKCFQYCILAALHPLPDHKHRVRKYKPLLHKLKCDGINSPVKLNDIPRFEKQNAVVVNVFGFSGKLYPLQLSKQCKDTGMPIINLLYLVGNAGQGHFSLITDLSKLLFQCTKQKSRKHFCERCLFRFTTKKQLQLHVEICDSDNQRVEMPTTRTKLKFEQYKCKLPQPICFYADFESFLIPVEKATTTSTMRKTHLHSPNSYAMYKVLQCCEGEEPTYGPLVLYRGPDCVEHFLEELIEAAEEYQLSYDFKQGMRMTASDRETHSRSNICHICEREIMEHDRGCSCRQCSKVRDHCHLCGRYRGPAHSWCNLKYFLGRDVTVMFHNLMRYDGKLILERIGKTAKAKGLSISVIPKGIEDYVTFSLTAKHEKLTPDGCVKQIPWRIKFLDSYQFLSSSLAALVENLKSSGGKERFKCVNKEIEADKVEMCLQKSIYPYMRVQSWSNFNETSLPDEDGFYDELKSESVTKEQMAHANTVWEVFEMRTFGHYHDHYLKLDVLLLCDVVESFRQFCRTNYGLDPAHYVTLPSFGWSAMLKMTGVELDLLTDPNMYLLIETAVRGGISMIPGRYAKANNPYLSEHDPESTSSYIVAYDMNNMYGGALSSALPYADFKWEDNPESIDFENIEDEADRGYIIVCDLEYPESLHMAHNDFPLAPEKMKPDGLSPYSQKLADKIGYKNHPTEKLIPNLRHKTNYVLHYRNLKFYLRKGMKLRAVHQVLSFKQKRWMEPYISFNTEQRKMSRTQFEKNMFKLFNNSAFGKSIQNVRKYITFKMVTDAIRLNRLISNPLFEAAYTFSEDLVGILLRKNVITLDQPIYAGFTCLELAKLSLYEFHYEFIKEKYGEKARLLATDTDSGIYHIETLDLYEDMKPYVDKIFDCSSYPRKHDLFSPKSALIPGLMKDETDGEPIMEFIGLRAKMYSIKMEVEWKDKKRAKGVSKSITEKRLTHEDYRTVLEEGITPNKFTMKTFRSDMLKIYTTEIDKIALCSIDDKRYVLPNGKDTLAVGHKSIKN